MNDKNEAESGSLLAHAKLHVKDDDDVMSKPSKKLIVWTVSLCVFVIFTAIFQLYTSFHAGLTFFDGEQTVIDSSYTFFSIVPFISSIIACTALSILFGTLFKNYGNKSIKILVNIMIAIAAILNVYGGLATASASANGEGKEERAVLFGEATESSLYSIKPITSNFFHYEYEIEFKDPEAYEVFKSDGYSRLQDYSFEKSPEATVDALTARIETERDELKAALREEIIEELKPELREEIMAELKTAGVIG